MEKEMQTLSAIKRAGRGMFGTPRIWNAPAGCGWREEKVQTTGLTARSPQLAGTFQALVLEFSRVRNFSVAGLKLAGLRSKPTSSEGKALSFAPHWCPEGCLHPLWVTTYRCDAAQKGGKAGKKFWGPKWWRLFFLFCDFRGGRWDGEEGALSVCPCAFLSRCRIRGKRPHADQEYPGKESLEINAMRYVSGSTQLHTWS